MNTVIHHPFTYSLGPLEITGFGLAMLLSFVIAQIISANELDRRGHSGEVMGDVTVAAVIGGLAGAKIYYAILMGNPLDVFHRAGFVFWGGLMGGIVAVFAVLKWKKLPFTRISDVAGVGIAAAYAVGRTGCWAVGDDYGGPWASRFAVAFPEGAPPSTVSNMILQFGAKGLDGRPMSDVVAVYPTQLFEVAMGMVMFGILWRLRDHEHAEGWLFGLYCVLAGTERFIIEFFRAKDDRFFGTFTLAQLIGLTFVAVGIGWMRMRRDVRTGAPGIYANA